MRVLIDTNVIISGLFWPGASKKLLNLARRKKIVAISSEKLFDELSEVLTNSKKPFRLSQEETARIIGILKALTTVVSPASHVAVCRDEDDNRVLECAKDGNVDFIVTGDHDLLDLKQFEGAPIVSVSEFLAMHG